MKNSEQFLPNANRISKTAVAVALILVFAAVLFGIYGPRIAGRLTLFGGIPLSGVVDAAANLRGRAVLTCLRNEKDSPLIAAEQAPLISRLLGRSFQLPDFTKSGYVLRQVSAASLPGAPYRSAELVFQKTTPDGDRWMVLYLAADDGQYLSFDKLGRSRPFLPETLLRGEISASSADESSALIWSDGPVLYIACVEDDLEAAALKQLIEVE